MKTFTITTHNTGKKLYEGRFETFRRCLEQAAAQNINLDYADLRHANLVNANLDNIKMRHARLDHANLMGANLSEALMDYTNFSSAEMQNTCLCESSLQHTLFEGALFGGTDITGAQINHSCFSTLSAFHLAFRDAESLHSCQFINPDGTPCPFSRPPVVIEGLTYPVILMDQHLKIGPHARTFSAWRKTFADADDNSRPEKNEELRAFYRENAALLHTLIPLRPEQQNIDICKKIA